MDGYLYNAPREAADHLRPFEATLFGDSEKKIPDGTPLIVTPEVITILPSIPRTGYVGLCTGRGGKRYIIINWKAPFYV